MTAPRIQLALDGDLPEAVGVLHRAIDSVDLVEAGTPLLLRRGLGAIAVLRAVAGATPILADVRIAEAGGAIAELAFAAGADVVTLLSSAGPATVAAVGATARHHDGAVHVELCSPYDERDLDRWAEAGVAELIVTRSRDGDQTVWAPELLDEAAALQARGFAITATGGVGLEDARLWRERGASTVIVGRAITAADDPAAAASEFRSVLAGPTGVRA